MYLHTFKSIFKRIKIVSLVSHVANGPLIYILHSILDQGIILLAVTFFSSFCMLIQCINCFTESESEQLGTHFQNIGDLLSIYLTHFQNNSLYASIKPDFNCSVFLYSKTFFYDNYPTHRTCPIFICLLIEVHSLGASALRATTQNRWTEIEAAFTVPWRRSLATETSYYLSGFFYYFNKEFKLRGLLLRYFISLDFITVQ